MSLSTRATRLLSMIRDPQSGVYTFPHRHDGEWMRLTGMWDPVTGMPLGIGRKTCAELVKAGILEARLGGYGQVWYRLTTPQDDDDLGDLWVADA